MASQVNGIIEFIQPGGTNGTKYAIASTAYGYCEIAANTAAKTVDMTDFKLEKGTTIYVKFANGNTTNSPTLNVQSTGAKSIVFAGTDRTTWPAGAILALTYDGTNWLVDPGTTYDALGPEQNSSAVSLVTRGDIYNWNSKSISINGETLILYDGVSNSSYSYATNVAF